MGKAFFLSLADWTKLSDEIKEQMELQREAAMSPPSVADAGIALAAKEFHRGWYEALAYVLDLSNSILKDDGQDPVDGKQGVDQEEVVEGTRIVPSQATRRPSRVF